jgi:hypothetical protein
MKFSIFSSSSSVPGSSRMKISDLGSDETVNNANLIAIAAIDFLASAAHCDWSWIKSWMLDENIELVPIILKIDLKINNIRKDFRNLVVDYWQALLNDIVGNPVAVSTPQKQIICCIFFANVVKLLLLFSCGS